MKVIIDRFEGDFVVCEKGDRQMPDIKKTKIPNIAKEGDANVTNRYICPDVYKAYVRSIIVFIILIKLLK